MKAYFYKDDLGIQIDEGDIPQNMKELADEYHVKLLEAVADHDDELMMMYLEGEDIPKEQLKQAIRKATINVDMVPVTCGSSYKNKGVQKLLDCVVDYMLAITS